MKPHELIAALVSRSGKSLRQVAIEMDKASFQGTLHKYVNGHVPEPTRSTAAKIARYFRIDVDVLYDSKAAEAHAQKLGIERPVAPTPPAAWPASTIADRVLAVEEHHQAAVYYSGRGAVRGLSSQTLQRINALSAEHLTALERIVVAYLDAIQPGAKETLATSG